MSHLTNHIHHHGLRDESPLHVIGVCSNFVRWHSRYRLAREWLEAMQATRNVKVHLVECAFGDREYELSEEAPESYLKLRTKSSIWNKENMINLGVRRLLPHDWKYMAWIDMDVFFRNPEWAQETLHQLQHFDVVQPWSECIDLGFSNDGMQMFRSFGKLHQMGKKKQKNAKEPYEFAHPGYAWACTRKFFESVSGLVDCAILGSGDSMMAWACIGDSAGTTWGMGKDFEAVLSHWERCAVRVTHTQVGFVNGIIEHKFHGSKRTRYYRSRNDILAKYNFNPSRDLYYDEQGLIQLAGKAALEHEIHKYNLSRHEDSIDD